MLYLVAVWNVFFLTVLYHTRMASGSYKERKQAAASFSFVAYVTVFTSSPVSAVRPIAHKILNEFSSWRQNAPKILWGGAKSLIFIGKILCSFVFFVFFFFNRRNAVAFFAVWRVSIFNEACWLILRLCYRVRNYFLVFYDYPRCNTCSLSEWLCSRRSRIVCDTFFLLLFVCFHLLIQLLLATFQTSHFTLPFHKRRH